MRRNTIQKKIIKEYLQKVKIHPTAQQVYLAIKRKIPHISQGTVYRILKNFSNQGIINEINLDVNHYDGDLEYHSHFICDSCHRIFDIYENKKINKYQCEFGEITSQQIHYHGVCNQCNNK